MKRRQRSAKPEHDAARDRLRRAESARARPVHALLARQPRPGAHYTHPCLLYARVCVSSIQYVVISSSTLVSSQFRKRESDGRYIANIRLALPESSTATGSAGSVVSASADEAEVATEDEGGNDTPAVPTRFQRLANLIVLVRHLSMLNLAGLLLKVAHGGPNYTLVVPPDWRAGSESRWRDDRAVRERDAARASP